MKQKKRYNYWKALCYFYHPFEDKIHLRKRIIRIPADAETFPNNEVEIWCEGFKVWWPFPIQNIKKIYDKVK